MREYSINVEVNEKLKAKVIDDESYLAKLTKEKQERSIIKETRAIGVQFNYLIPSIGTSIFVCVAIDNTDHVMCLYLWCD